MRVRAVARHGVRAGTDCAFLMACIHVILREFHVDKRSSYFLDYIKQYTNLPFLVTLEQEGNHFVSGRFLRASDIAELADELTDIVAERIERGKAAPST